ncbi:GNAT family N-acetyltransferase [Allostreptomyces psammosilenae]|uniref:GNAT superfamily N-acetyltransferase n=1 Tax=Allostreptomyces psammosilenae TaxID=1892865 RepID=A0A852ZZS6_9ACTN|nr:GNAT family N-acetyltransferase [Allostreptomyces psammosilenae]NYI07873.1 GNAT superfamily N-acetyltransferase [Allostreptomyces psammosilenae]
MTTSTLPTVRVRPGDQPGDLGAVTRLHGVLYAREQNWDQTVEAYVASGLADFALARVTEGDAAGRLWIAEADGAVVGAIGLTRADDRTGQLRWFLVDPSVRGAGLGRRLLTEALDYARARGFRGVFLWTTAGLPASRHLYDQAGFRLTESRPVDKWGARLTEQRFDLRLT